LRNVLSQNGIPNDKGNTNIPILKSRNAFFQHFSFQNDEFDYRRTPTHHSQSGGNAPAGGFSRLPTARSGAYAHRFRTAKFVFSPIFWHVVGYIRICFVSLCGFGSELPNYGNRNFIR